MLEHAPDLHDPIKCSMHRPRHYFHFRPDCVNPSLRSIIHRAHLTDYHEFHVISIICWQDSLSAAYSRQNLCSRSRALQVRLLKRGRFIGNWFTVTAGMLASAFSQPPPPTETPRTTPHPFNMEEAQQIAQDFVSCMYSPEHDSNAYNILAFSNMFLSPFLA